MKTIIIISTSIISIACSCSKNIEKPSKCFFKEYVNQSIADGFFEGNIDSLYMSKEFYLK